MPDIQDRPADWKMDYSQMSNVTAHDGTMLTPFLSDWDRRQARRRDSWDAFRQMQREAAQYLASIGGAAELTLHSSQQQTIIDIETLGL